MNRAHILSPSMLLIQPDYSTPVWTREQTDDWYYEFIREIGCDPNESTAAEINGHKS